MNVSDADAYGALFSADLSKLQTGVLKSIAAAIRQELDKRRHEKMAAHSVAVAHQSDQEKRFRGVSRPHHKLSHHSFRYLNTLLEQDWSSLFQGGSKERRFYVYMHIHPGTMPLRFVHEKCRIKTDGLPFYVGKGSGGRAYDLKRNQGHGAILKELSDGGANAADIVVIVKDGLTEPEALELESKLIYFFGTKYEKGRRGILVNLDIPHRPQFDC